METFMHGWLEVQISAVPWKPKQQLLKHYTSNHPGSLCPPFGYINPQRIEIQVLKNACGCPRCLITLVIKANV